MSKPKILVTGAAGAIGRSVLKYLVSNNDYDVVGLDLGNTRVRRILKPYQSRFQIEFADITNVDHLKGLTSGLDAVIHLAALIPPEADKKPGRTTEVNVKGIQNLIALIEQNSPEAFFIYTSSISVYGDRVDTPELQISDPVRISQGDHYGETKWQAEEILRNSRINWTIFRLTAILGTENLRVDPLMFHMPLNTSLEICSPGDTAEALVKAIKNPEALSGRTFNLGGGPSCRIKYQEFLEQNFSIMGLGRLDFPEHTFAEKNFHCGFYIEKELNEILEFQHDSLDKYFEKLRKKVSRPQYLATRLFAPVIKWYLLQQSDPWKAWRRKDRRGMDRYF